MPRKKKSPTSTTPPPSLAKIDLGLPQCGPTVWARVARLHSLLCQEQPFTAQSLACELETTDRTIKRTIQFMRDSLGAPIRFDPLAFTYHYTRHWPFLPLVRVRPDEAHVLKLMRQLCCPPPWVRRWATRCRRC